MMGWLHYGSDACNFCLVRIYPVRSAFNKYPAEKGGKKPYWLLFVLALILETASLWILLSLFAFLGADFLGIYLSPILSAIAAGCFYWLLSERKDADAVSNAKGQVS